MDIDVSLDDVIAKKRTRSGRGRGTPRGRTGTRTVSERSNVRDKYSSSVPAQSKASPLATVPGDATKIVVSNLPTDVTENQIRELFDTTVGRVKRIQLAYNSEGKFAGTATLEFAKSGDGNKAFGAYNGRLIDQKRPMKVEIILDPTKVPPVPLSSRVTPAKVEAASTASTSKATPETNGRRAPRGRGRGRGRRGRDSRPPTTAEELDKEMEVYTAGDGATA